MRMRNAGAVLAAAATLVSCTPRPAPPAPTPPPVSEPVPPSPAPAPLPSADWRDGPLAPGDWSYDQRLGRRAAFGAEAPMFVVECTADWRIRLLRIGLAAPSSPLTIRTTFGERILAASGEQSLRAATLTPSDSLLDEIVFSRGRFLVRIDGLPDLVIPAWPEPARVIEECRRS